MSLFDDIWGERQFYDLLEANDDDETLNLLRESPLVLKEDNIEEDKDTAIIYSEDQPSESMHSSFARARGDQEPGIQSMMPIGTKFEESVGNIQRSTTSLSLVQDPTTDSPGTSSQFYQNHSTFATMSPSSNTISNIERPPAVLERSSSLSTSFLSDKDNRHEHKHREDLSHSMMASRPSSRRREKNSIDIIIEEHNKKHAGKLGVTKANSKPLSPKVIQKKPIKRKGHKHSGSLERFKVECEAQYSGSGLSEIYQEYQLNHDETTQTWMFEEADSFQQMGQVQEVPQSVDSFQHMDQMGRIPPYSTSFQHMGQGMIAPLTHEVQQFNNHCQSLPSPQRFDTQQPSYSFQQMGHTFSDWGSYNFNYISALDEPHSPLFPERNLWEPRATDTLSNQSHDQFQMPAVQTQGFETQQYTTVRNENCTAASPSSLHEFFGSERGSGQSSESSTSPSFSPCQLQTDYTHRSETMQEWNR
ncbi:uncharacterized protein EAF02_007403 [Botrytis sinoallii]|uniref:uncharacterized protein n=1 Tax=Botrytis sinoallii TaxID=1463999 RepID=UPI0019022DFD|nr:uncharacterized protein EAF02_007403 [Botrytis sinoallii]KAF7880557.1 hypothetical protein EAF02_007403 [Botrytis sinoallii]